MEQHRIMHANHTSLSSKLERGINTYVVAVTHRGYLQIMLPGERCRENVCTRRSYNSAAYHIPEMMLPGENTAPCHITGKCVCRPTESPSIAALQIGCGRETDGCMTRGERMTVTHIGSPLLNTVFEDECGSGSRGCSLDTLDKTLPVAGAQSADKSRSRKRQRDNIC